MTMETKTRKGRQGYAVVNGTIVNTTTIRTDWRGTANFRLRRIEELEKQAVMLKGIADAAQRLRSWVGLAYISEGAVYQFISEYDRIGWPTP